MKIKGVTVTFELAPFSGNSCQLTGALLLATELNKDTSKSTDAMNRVRVHMLNYFQK